MNLYFGEPIKFSRDIASYLSVDVAVMFGVLEAKCIYKSEGDDFNHFIINSYTDLAKEFPFWSVAKVTKVFKEIKNKGIISNLKYDTWYKINYERIAELMRGNPND